MNTETDSLLADLATIKAAAARINAARRDARGAAKAFAAGRISLDAANAEHDRARAIIAAEMLAAVEAATGIASSMPLDDADAAADMASALIVARA